MAFLRNLARGAELRAFSGLASPGAWLSESLGVSGTYSGKRVSVDNAMGITSVYAAVTMISETIGLLPLKVFRYVDGNPVEAPQHRAWRMLHDKPNSLTPAQRFWPTVANHVLTVGNAFAEYGRSSEDGLVDELWLQDPQGMQILYDKNQHLKVYRKESGEGVKEWTDETMLHIMGPSRDGLIGMSPIAECRDALGTAMIREEFEGNFYKRGPSLGGWIMYPGSLTSKGIDNLSRSFARKYGGAEKAGGTPILEEGAEFREVKSPMADLQFVESKQMSRTDVAVIYHIPPAFIGGSTGDSLTYSTIESNKIHFADFAVSPVAMSIAKAVSASPVIFPQQNAFYAEHVFAGLLRADAKTRGEFYQLLYGMNAISDDEIRALENMGPRAQAPGEFKSDLAEPEPAEQLALPTGEENGNEPVESPGDLIARLNP